MPPAEYILAEGGESVTPALFCGVFVGGDCGDQGAINDWEVNMWIVCVDIRNPLRGYQQVAVAGDKPEAEEVAGPGEGAAVARVLQLADVHVDLSYSPGSPVACGLPCCCMNSTGQAAEGEAGAGPWGEYSCDIPLRTLDTMLAAAREQELDYIIYTGDR